MADWSFVNDASPMKESDLHECEEMVLSDKSLLHLVAAKLLAEVRRLRHELNDPSYLYSGTRIHRHAIASRDATISRLRKELEERQ